MSAKNQTKFRTTAARQKGIEEAWAKAKANDDIALGSVVKQIFDDCRSAYPQPATTMADISALTQRILKLLDPKSSSTTGAWQDYMRGVALTLDPLPQCPYTFHTSDVEALYSDWLTVDSDLSKSWHTFELARKTLEGEFSDVEHRKWNSAAIAAGDIVDAIEQDRAGNARPAIDQSTDTRNHSSGS